MRAFFLALALLFSHSLTLSALIDGRIFQDSRPKFTHTIVNSDFDVKVIVLDDGSVFGLPSDLDFSLIETITKVNKKTTTTVQHKMGYPLFNKDLWNIGNQLFITTVYLDENDHIREVWGLKTHENSPFRMLHIYTGEVESLMTPGTFIPSYSVQGPFIEINQ